MLKRHRCEICNKRFKVIEELMQHIQVIHGSESKYTCFECNKEFENGEELRSHARMYHTYKRSLD
ncbi:MAG: C2H2-type zinc finger protein [Candidatus Nitrosocaldaceae archaeon]